jgi:acyl carrier protein
LKGVFDDNSTELTHELLARDAYGWDSLTSICLIFTVEKKFDIKASTSEIGKLENVRYLIGLISRRRHRPSLGQSTLLFGTA